MIKVKIGLLVKIWKIEKYICRKNIYQKFLSFEIIVIVFLVMGVRGGSGSGDGWMDR